MAIIPDDGLCEEVCPYTVKGHEYGYEEVAEVEETHEVSICEVKSGEKDHRHLVDHTSPHVERDQIQSTQPQHNITGTITRKESNDSTMTVSLVFKY